MRYADNLPRFYVGTKNNYDKIHYANLDENGCYFLLDTQEIIFDGTSYIGILIFYSGDKPLHPSVNRLYMNTDDFEVSIWNGNEWSILYGPGDLEPISPNPEDPISTRASSGELVKDYTKRIVEESVLDIAEIFKMKWDNETRRLKFQLGNEDKQILITNIGNKLQCNKDTSEVYLLDEEGKVLSDFIMFPRHAVEGKFNPETLTIDFRFSNGPILKVPAGQLFNMMKGMSTASISIEPRYKERTLTMTVNRSAEYDNQFKILSDGVYFSYNRYIDKLRPGLQGAIVTLNDEGNSINNTNTDKVTISNEVIGTIPIGSSQKVVTEYVVAQALTKIHSNTSVKVSDYRIDPDNPIILSEVLCVLTPEQLNKFNKKNENDS